MSKLILITGATSGFGKATAEEFAQNDWDLIITGRRNERLVELKTNLENQYNIKVTTLCFDVQNKEAVNAALKSIQNQLNNLDVLVNNAGLALGKTTFDKAKIEDWDTMIDTNVKGLLYVSKAIIPYLIENKKGHIFNIGSTAGKETYLNGNVYCASKHAVDSITKSMRIDLLPHNIKVTGICPGLAETEFSVVRHKGNQEMADNTYKGMTPLYAKDIAEIIYFAANRPAHVCMNDIVITPTAQANSFYVNK